MRITITIIAAAVWFALAMAVARPQILPHVAENTIAQADVLVVYHGYNGATETAGDVIAWKYVNGHMRLDYGDLSADGIFHNGFESP